MNEQQPDASAQTSEVAQTPARPWVKFVHMGVFAAFAGPAWLFAIVVAPPEGHQRLVMWIAMWFGLSYIYGMLLVSFWVRKRFEGSRGKVEDHQADFHL